MRKEHQQPTQRRLHELFSYDPSSGNLLARLKKPHRPIGKIIGSLSQSGYFCVEVDSYHERVHRLIWIMHNGSIPPKMVIDHINRVRTDNRIENLRLVTARENTRNIPLHHKNTSGFSGVRLDKRGRWIVNLNLHIGAFALKEDAVAARRIARDKLNKLFDAGMLQ